MTERYDTQSQGTGFADRVSVASDSSTQAAAGATGAKTSAITSGHWLAHLLAFRVDDAAPSVTMSDPGSVLRGTVTFNATASDDDSGVARVQFQRAVAGSGTWVNAGSAVTAPPYQRTFATTGLAGYYLSRPTMETLYSGLDRDDISAIGAALREAGVPFDVNAESTVVLTPAGQAAAARMILAEKGLPTIEVQGGG